MGLSDPNANNWTPGKKNEKGGQKSISQIWLKKLQTSRFRKHDKPKIEKETEKLPHQR